MRLLHFRRTFVEKMFTIHGKVEAFKGQGSEIGGYARHYYDLHCLAERPEVLAMLRSAEYVAIKADYDRVSREQPGDPIGDERNGCEHVAHPAGHRTPCHRRPVWARDSRRV
jgi:hypothetical protein